MIHDTHIALTLPEIPRSETPKRTTPRLSWLVASMLTINGQRLSLNSDAWLQGLTHEKLDMVCNKLLADLKLEELRDEVHRWRAECRRYLATGAI